MANPIVLAFDTVGHPLGLDFWLEGLHLYFHSVTRDDVSLFEHTSGSLQAPKAPAEPAADAGEEVRTKFRAAHIAYKRWMARDAAATLAVRLHLSFDQRANFRQVPSAHAMYSAVVRRYSPPPLAVLGCLVLPLTFLALSDLITVAIEGGRSGAGGSGGGGHQELEPSCVAACAPTSIVYAYPSTVLLCLVVPSASSGSTEGGDPTAADTATSRRSPRLETPPGFPSQTSLPPLQPVVADFGGPGVVGGGDAGVAASTADAASTAVAAPTAIAAPAAVAALAADAASAAIAAPAADAAPAAVAALAVVAAPAVVVAPAAVAAPAAVTASDVAAPAITAHAVAAPLLSRPLQSRPLLSRPCPAPAPGKHPRRPAAPRCQELNPAAKPSRAAQPSRATQPSRAARRAAPLCRAEPPYRGTPPYLAALPCLHCSCCYCCLCCYYSYC
ncbi:unnamed protein product [Closterium sp. NIES-54]